jgi:hypothetical protein
MRALILICVLVLAACGQKSEWRELAVAEGGFRILMRGQPQYARQQVDTPAGKMEAHLYSSDRPDAYFAVGYSDYPLAFAMTTGADEILAGVRDTWMRKINGTLVTSAKEMKSGKYPGMQFTARGRVNGKEALLEAELYLVDQRLYQVVAISRSGEASQGVVNRYLSSFKLTRIESVGRLQIEPKKDPR